MALRINATAVSASVAHHEMTRAPSPRRRLHRVDLVAPFQSAPGEARHIWNEPEVRHGQGIKTWATSSAVHRSARQYLGFRIVCARLCEGLRLR